MDRLTSRQERKEWSDAIEYEPATYFGLSCFQGFQDVDWDSSTRVQQARQLLQLWPGP